MKKENENFKDSFRGDPSFFIIYLSLFLAFAIGFDIQNITVTSVLVEIIYSFLRFIALLFGYVLIAHLFVKKIK